MLSSNSNSTSYEKGGYPPSGHGTYHAPRHNSKGVGGKNPFVEKEDGDLDHRQREHRQEGISVYDLATSQLHRKTIMGPGLPSGTRFSDP